MSFKMFTSKSGFIPFLIAALGPALFVTMLLGIFGLVGKGVLVGFLGNKLIDKIFANPFITMAVIAGVVLVAQSFFGRGSSSGVRR